MGVTFSETFIALYDLWEQGQITNSEFLEKSGLKPATFFYMVTEYRQYKKSENGVKGERQ